MTRMERITLLAAGMWVTCTAACSLAGYALKIPDLANWRIGYVLMAFNTATCFLAVGITFLVLAHQGGRNNGNP